MSEDDVSRSQLELQAVLQQNFISYVEKQEYLLAEKLLFSAKTLELICCANDSMTPMKGFCSEKHYIRHDHH